MSQPNQPTDRSEKPKPIHTIRLGSIHAAIWSNPGQHGPFYAVTFERRFRDQKENWQSSASYSRDDLLVLAKLADLTHTIVCERQAADRGRDTDAAGRNGSSRIDEGGEPHEGEDGSATHAAPSGSNHSRSR